MKQEDLDSYKFSCFEEPLGEMSAAIMHKSGDGIRMSNSLMQEYIQNKIEETVRSAFL